MGDDTTNHRAYAERNALRREVGEPIWTLLTAHHRPTTHTAAFLWELRLLTEIRRHAAVRALAELADACAVYDLNGFGPCDPGCRHTDCGNVRRGLEARRGALEKEIASAQ